MEIQEAFRHIEQRTRELVNYSDKLRESFKNIDIEFSSLFKEAGVVYTDSEPIDSDDDFSYYLKIGKDRNGYWGFIKTTNDYYVPEVEMVEQSRFLIKKTILRLPTFLQCYIERLDKTTEEYKKASEMAEAMCKVLTNLNKKEG